MTLLTEHSRVVLMEGLPELGLSAGMIGTIIHVHREPPGYEIEFFSPTGETVAIGTAHPHQVRLCVPRDMVPA